jgi:uncharacterized membrane protein
MTSSGPVDVSTRASGRVRTLWQGVSRWLQDHMAWNLIFRAISYLRSALWVVPVVAVILARAFYRLLSLVDPWVTWELIGLGVRGAQAMFQTIITLTLSVIVFTFGSLLVAIQVAGGQLTPRIIATLLLRDAVIKYTVGLNVFTLLFAVSGLNRTETEVFQLATGAGALLGIACLASFLFLIDHAARLLRPVQIVTLVCDEGMAVVRKVYPREQGDSRVASEQGWKHSLGAPARVVLQQGRSQSVLAVQIDELVAEAKRAGGVIEFVPQVGDFVASDEPLFRLYGGAAKITDELLHEMVAFGPERTMEQDPMFSFRILVDVALKALSPAINDPTTAVLSIDQIHRLLRAVGKRHLHGETVSDSAGRVRVILRTPDWEDFVHVACCEIRACGANNLQIVRRMRAMLENLVRTLPESRHAALREQLDLLDRSLPDQFRFEEDLALARIADPQGLGGGSGETPRA